MKKRDVFLLIGALACLYFILSFSLVFEIDQIGTREQLRLRRARKALEANPKVSWLEDFFNPRCRCPATRGQHSIVRGQASAHALAIHATLDKDTCHISEAGTKKQNVDIQVSTLLREMRLSYPQYVYHHTGWIQQMDVTYSASQWDKEPLRVFYVLHSHNDPGWKNTYSGYYSSMTSIILNKAVEWLEKDSELKFVWAEVIYLRRWYEEASAAKKRSLHRLILNGQLEVVTGGLVMSDEAAAHYHAMLDQLIEGHQWLAKTFNVFPKHGWAIDPFGHSSTMTYLLKRSGLEATVIQRIHYAMKQHLAPRKQLEFIWKQTWDHGESDTGLFSHTMPFLYYNIQYSCGPDIQVCCQFDFAAYKCWAWGKYQLAEEINEKNIKQKSEALLDQLRKKAQFYKHNILLVPHGDDFRYTSDKEWRLNTENLKKLFAYMNNRPDMRVKLEFGTLADYFSAVQNADVSKSSEAGHPFPSLSGDFFTYTDRDDQYWSGYFTSRPYLKSLIRKLQYKSRMAEILFTLGQGYASRRSRRILADYVSPLYRNIMDTRNILGLLQHHDAVTGTSKAAVVLDYTEKARSALGDANIVITRMFATLLQLGLRADIEYENFDHTLVTMHEKTLPVPLRLNRKEKDIKKLRHTLVIHNSLGVVRHDVVTVTVPNLDVTVSDASGSYVKCQIDPIFMGDTGFSVEEFQLSFEVTIPPLGIAQYHLHPTDVDQGCHRANVSIFNGKPEIRDRRTFHVRHHSVLDSPQSIQNTVLLARICTCTGLLKSVSTKMDGIEHKSEMRIVTYGTGSWSNPYRDKSGAYIFMPDGVAEEIKYDAPTVVVTRGILKDSIHTHIPLMDQKITLFNIEGPLASALHIENKVNITGEKNLELAMRLITDINNMDGDFYTDLNGFQMSTRYTQHRLPLQGNFYPATTAAFVQDDLFRATVLTAQSHGVSALRPGWLEFVLDRELEQDDWRGLNEGVKDNVPVLSQFQLLWESSKPTFHNTDKRNDPDAQEASVKFLSLLGHLVSQMLNNPPEVATLQTDFAATLPPAAFEPLNEALPCDMYLVNLRSLGTSEPDTRSLLILHRLVSDCDFPESFMKCDASSGKIQWTVFFSQLSISKVEETSLTGTQVARNIHHSYFIVQPMEIVTFKVLIN